jgi:predicted PurR-regulated permease PerM
VAAILSVVLVLLTVVAPLLGLAGVIAGEAAAVAQSAGPWVKERLGSQADLDGYLRRQPFYPRIEPYRRQVLEASGEAASRIGHFLVNGVSAAAKGTVGFLLHLSIMLYALYFFLVGGAGAVEKAISYVPLPAKQMRMLLDKFVSVSGATLKGTLLVGIVQGALAGVGFAAAGIPHSVFWATVTAVLSILPGIGTGLVWVPAAIFLAVTGRLGAGLGLTAWCLVVVGTADNFLRPRLVGRDTEMPDLLILVSTLGGLTLFGAAGFLIGPVVAALFLAVWDLYRAEFRGYLDPAGTNPPIGVDSPGQAG